MRSTLKDYQDEAVLDVLTNLGEAARHAAVIQTGATRPRGAYTSEGCDSPLPSKKASDMRLPEPEDERGSAADLVPTYRPLQV